MQIVKAIPIATRTPKQVLRKYLRKKAWNWFDWNQNIFIKPNDGISHLPLMGETHDQEVVQALIHLAKFLPGTFLDIGANIGLVSVAMAGHVGKIICIEANPLVSHILRVNLTLNCTDFEIHEYALGAAASTATLHVPRKNLGGAFLLDANQYDLDQLARKDGYACYSSDNYLAQEVTIRACDEVFSSIQSANPKSLLLKIDVEGLDQLVLQCALNIFQSMCARGAIALVFESHDRASASWLRDQTLHWGYEVYGLRVTQRPNIRQPMLRRLFKLVLGERRELEFIPLQELGSDTAVTNFACCPSSYLNR